MQTKISHFTVTILLCLVSNTGRQSGAFHLLFKHPVFPEITPALGWVLLISSTEEQLGTASEIFYRPDALRVIQPTVGDC